MSNHRIFAMINATYHPTTLLMNQFPMNLMNHRSNPIHDLSFNIVCSIRNNHCLTNPRFSRFPANKQLLNHASNDAIWSNVPTNTAANWLQRVARFDPLAYWVDWMRRALSSNSFFWMWTNVIVLWIMMILFIIIGWYTFNKMKADN